MNVGREERDFTAVHHGGPDQMPCARRDIERRISVASAVALVTTAAIFFLFDMVLRVRFPRGLLTNLYYG